MNTYSKKIIFLITGLDYGGMEIQLIQLASHLSHQGWTVKVVSMIKPQEFVPFLKGNSVSVDTLNMLRGYPDPRAILKFAKIINQIKPPIVHSHLVHANLLSRVTRLFASFPIQISTSGNIYEGALWRELGYKLTDYLCDKTTNVSKIALERYVKDGLVPAHKIYYLPNGVDVTVFSPNNVKRKEYRKKLNLNGKFVWLAIGRLERQKNYPSLIEAFRLISQGFPNALLLICGKGSLKQDLMRLVSENNLSNRIIFLGVRKDIPNIMNASDAYVMSSDWEGLPAVLLEASATALPIVATDVSGNREVVLHKTTGFLIKPDNPSELETAMKEIMSLTNEERRSLGLAGRNHIIENFSYPKVASLWEKLYSDSLSAKNITLD